MFIWDFLLGTVMDQFIDWIYGQVIGFLGDFFAQMGNMGVELFEMDWVASIVLLFSYLAWALYGTGLVVAAFETGIEYQHGRGSIRDTALNVIKGFMAVSLFTIAPVELFKLSVNLQSSLTAGITGYGQSFGEMANGIISGLRTTTDLTGGMAAGVFGGLSAITSPIMLLFMIIMMGYAVIKVFFANLKRGGILLIQIAVGSLYTDQKAVATRKAKMPRLESRPEINEATPNFDSLSEMKIGVMVRTVLKNLLEQGAISEEEMHLMQTKEYSKETFDIQYPLLLPVQGTNSGRPARYYSAPITVHGNKYFLCSEWFEVPANNDTEQSKYSGKYALSELLICGECLTPYKRTTWTKRGGEKQIVWRCISRLDYGTKYCKDSVTIDESSLHEAIMQAINATRGSRHEMIPYLTAQLTQTFRDNAKGDVDVDQIENRIAELKAQTMELIAQSIGNNTVGENEGRLRAMSDEIKALCDMLTEYRQSCNTESTIESRVAVITETLENEPEQSDIYNDTLVRQLIDTIMVMGEDRLEITFKCGLKHEQRIIPKVKKLNTAS